MRKGYVYLSTVSPGKDFSRLGLEIVVTDKCPIVLTGRMRMSGSGPHSKISRPVRTIPEGSRSEGEPLPVKETLRIRQLMSK